MKHACLLKMLLTSGVLFLNGCAAYVGTPIIGGLYTDVKAPIAVDPGQAGQGYQVLGVVEGQSTATSILGIVATGDASVNAAYQNALRKISGAESLVDVTVDYQGRSVFGIFASYTTIVRGKAIKRM
jgi:hypothetical protein